MPTLSSPAQQGTEDWLIDVLACPHCRGPLERKGGDALQCGPCNRSYRIVDGVPDLVVADEAVLTTGQRFDFQWQTRSGGGFESPSVTYGTDNDAYAIFMADQLKQRVPPDDGAYVLDVGCGPGDLAATIARAYPKLRVVGIDLAAGALAKAHAHYRHLPNLRFVRGNALRPPLRPNRFLWAWSSGVLHHTPDTRGALTALRNLISRPGALLVWLYPLAKDAPEWRLPYLCRDKLFFGQAHRLPPPILRALCRGLFLANLPLDALVIDPLYKARWRALKRDSLPYVVDADASTYWQRLQAREFLLFDTLLPEHQTRHPPDEVARWLEEDGLRPDVIGHGWYLGY